MSHEVKQVKETLQIACIHNKSGTGATATVNDIPVILFVVKTEEGKLAYHYACACKNYKLNEETGKYKCETALGSGVSSCQIEEVLNDTLEREGILYVQSG
ncbi:MAG: hypothetical protein KAJ07_11590 [Planctomycetes bacterium]|nr:hypothetical protein [Planctomycetota bacterium]